MPCALSPACYISCLHPSHSSAYFPVPPSSFPYCKWFLHLCLLALAAMKQTRLNFNCQNNKMQSNFVTCNNKRHIAWCGLSLVQSWSCSNSHRATQLIALKCSRKCPTGLREMSGFVSHACKLNSDWMQNMPRLLTQKPHVLIKMLFSWYLCWQYVCGVGPLNMQKKKKHLEGISNFPENYYDLPEEKQIANSLNSFSMYVSKHTLTVSYSSPVTNTLLFFSSCV